MLKHILLFKLKESALGRPKMENCAELKKQLEALKSVIKELIMIEVGVNAGKSPRAWDVSLYSEFKNFEDLIIYQEHPAHLEVVKFVNEVSEDRHVVDYEA